MNYCRQPVCDDKHIRLGCAYCKRCTVEAKLAQLIHMDITSLMKALGVDNTLAEKITRNRLLFIFVFGAFVHVVMPE